MIGGKRDRRLGSSLNDSYGLLLTLPRHALKSPRDRTHPCFLTQPRMADEWGMGDRIGRGGIAPLNMMR